MQWVPSQGLVPKKIVFWTTDGLFLLSHSLKCFSWTVITEGEVISWVSTKFKLALNNWTKTFKWTPYFKRNWCRRWSWQLMSLSRWAAGICAFFPQPPGYCCHPYLKIQKTVRSPPEFLRLQIGKSTVSIKLEKKPTGQHQNPQTLRAVINVIVKTSL